MDLTPFMDILEGNIPLSSLPETQSKVIRVYLSCTASDTETERNELVKNIYPRLREYCRENYGLEFQIVDPRWGVEENLNDLSDDREIYHEEVIRCKQTSAGPCFVTILGQKYGMQPLPSVIVASDYDLIRSALRLHRNRDTREAALLDVWYTKDTNMVVPAYRLLPIEKGKDRQKAYIEKTSIITGEKDRPFDWQETRTVLSRLIQKGVEYCMLEGNMSETDAQNYLMSDVEREITSGVLHSDDPANTCLGIVRNIVDLKNYVTLESASRFMEISYNEKEERLEPDSNVQKLINSLRDEKLKRWLPRENRQDFSILWKYDYGIDPNLHKDYLESVKNSFYTRMKELIDRGAHTHSQEPLPAIIDEIVQHWMVTREKCTNFIGREDILDIIRSYVMSNDPKPLVLYGASGSGKSSIIAKAVSEVSDWMENDVIAIVRFLGVTAASFDIRQILYNICHQIVEVLGGKKESIPNAYKELQTYFIELLQFFPEDRNIVIFIDSLDMLVPQYNAHFMYWLPKELKENVKIVVSTLPDSHNILQRLQKEVIQDDNNFLEIPPMAVQECLDLLNTRLLQANKRLSSDQEDTCCRAFDMCAYPLYAELLLREARTWTSSTLVSSSSLPCTIKDYISATFDSLEAKHGKVFVSRALAYLTASTTGVSDSEMEDLLSLDDKVLNEVFEKGAPPVRRLPPLVWLRLKHEIKDFLRVKDAEGVTVSFWNHRLFMEVVKNKYLKDEAQRKEIHSCLADYNLGVWHGKAKPFKRPSSSNNNSVSGEEDRLVPSQPLTFTGSAGAGTCRFNKRKYEQVPRHLYLSGRLTELNQLVLFSYEWIYNKTKALSLEHVLTDFVLNPGVEATLVEQALRDAQPFIAVNIDNMSPEISGRLLAYYGTHSNIRKLIQECDTAGLKHCALIPNFPYHQVPGSPLKYTIESKGKPSSFSLLGNDSRYMLIKEATSPTVQVYDLATGEHTLNVNTSKGDMLVTPNGQYIAIVDHAKMKAIKIHANTTGHYLGQLIPVNLLKIKPHEKYKLGKVTLSDTHACMLVTTEKSAVCVADIESCKFVDAIRLEGRAKICTITSDSRYVFTNSNEKLLAYDLITMRQTNSTELEYRPTCLIFNSDSSKGFLINERENKLFLLVVRDGAVEFLYKVLIDEAFVDDQVEDLQLSNAEDMVLCRGSSNLLVYHVGSEKIICNFDRPKDIPKEFKLPRSHYKDIHFTAANFSPDDKFVIATIFRNLYIWNIANNRLLTTLQAPVGLIDSLHIPSDRGQIVTHLEGSGIIHVWSLGDAIGHVGMLDRLTAPVEDVKLTADDKIAFVRCTKSDEIGVLDMKSGQLIDLLTHESHVENFASTADGQYVLVALNDAKPNSINKIWHVNERKVIYEFGNVPAFFVPLQTENTVVSISQDENVFKAPYKISQFKFEKGMFDEYRFDNEVKFVLDKPFVTPEDRYLVMLSADDYDEHNAYYINPTICAISLKSSVSMAMYSANELKDHVFIRRILHIRPYNNSYTVIVLFTNEPDLSNIDSGRRSRGYDHCYGFMIFDVCSGVVCQVIDSFMAPNTPMDQVLFTSDVRLCLDHESNVFDMGTGYWVKRLFEGPGDESKPRRLALNGEVAVFFCGQHLYAIRISDEKCIGHLNAHGDISAVEVCNDGRTLVVGSKDGALISYVLIDESNDNSNEVLQNVITRQVKLVEEKHSAMVRSWDKVDFENALNCPPYSRPPSGVLLGPTDKELLQKVKPAQRSRPVSDTYLYTNSTNSKACVVM